MAKYDFHSLLEPLEFEKLVCDIVGVREGIFVETYKEGRDLGIDGSYTDRNKKLIVQAKRYAQNFKRLCSDLKYKELPKVRKLNPDRYILGISFGLSHEEKEELIELFRPYVVNSNDILSQIDLNRLLQDPLYKHVELAYPKLWVPSINVFKRTLHESVHRAAYKESAEELKEALKTSQVFVSTQIYREALSKWSTNHVIVLSGEPGVGKTTMAYLLALSHLQPNNLDGFIWANSIHDVYSMLEDEQQQVIILDDFWGSIFHEKHSRRNDENRLEKLIRMMVESKGNKRIVLTTREYVLQQGLQEHPGVRKLLEQYSLVCTVEEYSTAEKASILFSHLYASRLEYEYVVHLYGECERIVSHENYNPRVLARFLSIRPDKMDSPEEYFEQLLNYFDHPDEFWKAIFIELSTEAQLVAMLLLISSTPMRYRDMERCYQKYIHNSHFQNRVKNLAECLAELEKTMFKSFFDDDEEEVLLKFSVPGIQDFLYKYIDENGEQLIPLLLRCCTFFNQLQFLLEYHSELCSDQVLDEIIQQCILHYDDYENSTTEYDGSWNWDEELFENSGYLDRLFHLLCFYEKRKHTDLYLFIERKINDYCMTMGEDNPEEQYSDLHNLPGILVRCNKLGMQFNGEFIISKYLEQAWSAYHFLEIRKLKNIFPNEYSVFNQDNFPMKKKNLKSIIFSELEMLEDYWMDFERDLLIDGIPEIFNEFGLRYTKKFGQEILEFCGREPISSKKNSFKKRDESPEERETPLNFVKEDARNWLLGPRETDIGQDQILEMIEEIGLSTEVKTKVLSILDSEKPIYMFEFLRTKEAVELLLGALQAFPEEFPESERSLGLVSLHYIGDGDTELITQLIVFCAETFNLIKWQDEPIIRIHQFLSSEVYQEFLESNERLRQIVFDHLVIKNEQWVRFLHVPIFIFCYVFMVSSGSEIEELQPYFQLIWKGNSDKCRIVEENGTRSSIGYSEYGNYYFNNHQWEGCMYRMWRDLAPYYFNSIHVEPMLKSYLDMLGKGDKHSKVLNHLSKYGVQLRYDTKGKPDSSVYIFDDIVGMIEHLQISALLDFFPKDITKKRLKELERDKEVCQSNYSRWTIFTDKIESVELLQELGIYDEVAKFIKGVEKTYAEFEKGNFWYKPTVS